MFSDIMTYPIKIGMNQSIRVSQNSDPQFRKIGITFFICGSVLRCQMLSAVQLNNDLLTVNIKIDNVIENHFLAMNHNRQRLQKLIPKLFFFIGHFPAKCAGVGGKLFVMWYRHGAVLVIQ